MRRRPRRLGRAIDAPGACADARAPAHPAPRGPAIPSRSPPDPVARRRDLALALATTALGLLLALWVIPVWVRAPVEPRPLPMAPWFMPQIAAGLMVASGAALAVGAWRRPRDRGGEGGGDPAGLGRALAALAAYVALMPALGALTTGVLVTGALVAASGAVGPWRTAAVGLGVPALAWLMFSRLAGTPLPRGPWGLP